MCVDLKHIRTGVCGVECGQHDCVKGQRIHMLSSGRTLPYTNTGGEGGSREKCIWTGLSSVE